MDFNARFCINTMLSERYLVRLVCHTGHAYSRSGLTTIMYTFEVNNCTGHIFKFVSLAAIVKSKMAVIELFIYLIKNNIECFSFESIMHVIVPKYVGKHQVITLIDTTNDLEP